MTGRRSRRAGTRHLRPIAGTAALLCGLGLVVTALGDGGATPGASGRTAEFALRLNSRSAAVLRSFDAHHRATPALAARANDGTRGEHVASPAAERFSGERPGMPIAAKILVKVDARGRLLSAAGLARHRREPEPFSWIVTSDATPTRLADH